MNSDQERWLVGIMLSVTLVKLLLVMYCRSFTNEIVKAYAQDHFFDVITNIIGLIAALLANYVSDWMDPVGAIIVSTTANFFHAFAFWWLHIRYPIRLHVSDRIFVCAHPLCKEDYGFHSYHLDQKSKLLP